MSLQDDVKTLLTANATLVAAFTGGIKVYDELGVSGLSRALTPNATNATTGVIKPLIVIRERSETMTTAVRDTATQVNSYQQSVEVLLYNDKTSGFGTLETGASLIYGLLHGKKVSSMGRIYQQSGSKMERDRNFDNACSMLLVFGGAGVKRP